MRRLPRPDPGTPDARSPLRYLLWLARRQARTIVGGMFFGILWMVSQAVLPAAVGHTVDAGVTAKNGAELVRWSLVVVGLAIAKAASGILRHRNALSNFLAGAYTTVQVVTQKTVELGATLSKRVAAGDVVAVGTSDINEIGHALDITARLTGALVAIATVAAIMLAGSVPLGLIVLIGVPVLSGLTGLLLKPLHDRQRRYRVLQGELTGRAVDIAAGLRVLRGIGGEPAFAERYRSESQELRHAAYAVTRVESGLAASEVMLPGVITAGVTFVAARFALDARLTIGQLVAFYGYATFLAAPLRTLTEGADLITRGHVAARRVIRILNLEPGLGEAEHPAPMPAHGSALADAESGLEIKAGELFAIACADPADADMLAERLARFEDSGKPTLGGVPLRDLPLDGVRQRILLARNSDTFFNGPLRTELDPTGGGGGVGSGDRASEVGGEVSGIGSIVGSGGRDRGRGSGRGADDGHGGSCSNGDDVGTGDRGDEEILAAIRAASAQDILDALPDGLATEMTDGGREFSGGQLQRLRLVRALVVRRDVTLLVEPTSAVDAHTEARIAEHFAEAHAAAALVADDAAASPELAAPGPAAPIAAAPVAAVPITGAPVAPWPTVPLPTVPLPTMPTSAAASAAAPATTILFTTSPLLLDRAHRVAYVEDGRAVAIGTHRELLRSSRSYASVVTRGEDLDDTRDARDASPVPSQHALSTPARHAAPDAAHDGMAEPTHDGAAEPAREGVA